MKRFLTIFFLFTFILTAKVVVFSSVAPISSLIKSIGKDQVDVVTVVEAGKSPHTYEPKVSIMKKLEKAKLYFGVGVEFERAWLKRFKTQNPSLKIINLDENVTKILMMVKSKIAKEDPHIWLSPKNMEIFSEIIFENLSKIDPAQKEFFRKNYQITLKNIQELDKKIREILKNIPKKAKFMVFHPSWGYFAKDYHLMQVPIEIEGKEPKPSQLIKLIKLAKKENIKIIITEPEFSSKSATLLAKELGAKVIKLSPLNPNWEDTLLKLAKSIAKGFEN